MSTIGHMFAHVPKGKPSLRAAYETWLRSRTPRGTGHIHIVKPLAGQTVGIVGGGMAGLYSALLLKFLGAKVTIFEAHPSRLGGRVYTHRFTSDKNQYFEAGAMRLPEIPEQQPVFELIDYLNQVVPPSMRINLLPYTLYCNDGNLVYVNGKRASDGSTMTINYANAHTAELGFPDAASKMGVTANQLLTDAIQYYTDLLQKNFNQGFEEIVKLDNLSFFTWLTTQKGWSQDQVNYVEVMETATNQYQNSFTEMIIESMDFSQATWHTIEDGMDRLPNACAYVIGQENIQFSMPCIGLEQSADGKQHLHFANGQMQAFDKVIMAIPPAALRMIETPTWSATKMQAIRSMHYEPLYKIGLRFKTRFWEQVAKPSNGGQSITDLRTRWCVYPSYGIGDQGPGVLLLYSWMTDAYNFLPVNEADRVRIGLEDLQKLYQGTVDIKAQFIEAFSVAWPVEWATGDAMFFPGQFGQLFNVAREPEGNVFFAGEHLSVQHTWIVGAIDSALVAVKQMLGSQEVAPIAVKPRPPQHDYDYSAIAEMK
jgi:monoamine oxidase